jgi:hypothetical protein
VCLAAHAVEFHVWTSGFVKLLLPPRQSRGVSFRTSPNVITEDDAAFFCAAEGTNGAHVGEMHPLVALTPAQYLAMFEQHRTNGAVLVAPFYMSVFPQSRNPTSNLGQYLIAPYYPDFASDLYYAAIQNALTQ